MATQRIRGGHLALFGLSIACSVGSLAALLTHPARTASLRTALNVLALLLFVIATTMVARASSAPVVKRRGANGRGI